MASVSLVFRALFTMIFISFEVNWSSNEEII